MRRMVEGFWKVAAKNPFDALRAPPPYELVGRMI